MKKLLIKITSMIRRAVVSLSKPDSGNYPTTQVSYLGKTADIEVIWPYGMNGRLPLDAQVLCFNVEGMEENKAGIGNVPTIRLKVDAEGEVVFGNPLTESAVYFRENGDIEVVGTNGQSVTITEDYVLTAENVTLAAATQANLLAPTVNLGIDGGTFRKMVDERFVALFNAHVHPDPVSGNTGAPTVSMSVGSHATSNTKAS